METEGVFKAVFKTLVAAIEEDEGECILKVELKLSLMPVPLFDRVSEFRMFPTEMGALSDSQLVTLNPGLEYLGRVLRV